MDTAIAEQGECILEVAFGKAPDQGGGIIEMPIWWGVNIRGNCLRCQGEAPSHSPSDVRLTERKP